MATEIEFIARAMAEFAADTDRVRVEVDSEDSDEVRTFLAWLSSDLTEDAAKSLCHGWARLIRRSLPDRHDGWSSTIVVIGPLGSPLGVYFVGWIGHEDTWDDSPISDETFSQDWNALYQRLAIYLRNHGRNDNQGHGDYFLLDEDYGNPDQSITIFRIEFLTRDLVSGIQKILRDGYEDWSVIVHLDLSPGVESVPSDGIDIYADRIVEKWDRALLVERLGKRLRF